MHSDRCAALKRIVRHPDMIKYIFYRNLKFLNILFVPFGFIVPKDF
jgi:hypothetical protein